MTTSLGNLFGAFVVQTDVNSITAPYLYSDYCYKVEPNKDPLIQDPLLNQWARVPLIGIIAGVARKALAFVHIAGHLTCAVITRDKGHLYHAMKGGCEFVRGHIESLFLIGRIFAWTYSCPPNYWNKEHYTGTQSWWFLKIYNPNSPDDLDRYNHYWKDFAKTSPTALITA
jgi:hypothetical protein